VSADLTDTSPLVLFGDHVAKVIPQVIGYGVTRGISLMARSSAFRRSFNSEVVNA
jgi:hypothetical protein